MSHKVTELGYYIGDIWSTVINAIIISVIYIDYQLHTPMYLFLCNLALVDICYTTTTVPNLLYMLLSGDITVSFIECFTQMYFYFLSGSSEINVIFIMAYDRYVAICDPLRFHTVLNRKHCVVFASGTWISGCLNSFVITIPASHLSFCHSRTLNQFFCDAKALINISCGGSEDFSIVIYTAVMVYGTFPVMFCLASYIKIIRVILQTKSKDGRKKAFSTCSSHLTVVIMFYMTNLSVYLVPPSDYSSVLEPVFSVLYSIVTPTINPLIYSLQNKDMKSALLRLLAVETKS
ncbi:olfactory receptor 2M2-like [Pseudophryne corroboree]|uniref:olfactory receptor 2M2-like n=1 Tax=Pseudophryne corroboree TaxID=495146 RepID=UPI003082111D